MYIETSSETTTATSGCGKMAKVQAGQLIGYMRCSTSEQNLDSQKDALTAAGCQKFYQDQLSGKNTDRPGLQEALEYMRPGDTLVVFKLDRLSRSTKDMLILAEQLKQRGINLKSLSDDIDTSSPHGAFFFTIVAAFAELERNMIVARTHAGLESARQRGRVGGRPELVTKDKAEAARGMLEKGMAAKDVAAMLSLSKATMYRGIAKHCPM